MSARTITQRIISGAVDMHMDARILLVCEDHGVFKLWALEDRSRPMEVRHFKIVEDGEELPEPHEYVGSIYDIRPITRAGGWDGAPMGHMSHVIEVRK